MKRIILSGVAVVLMLSLIGCGNNLNRNLFSFTRSGGTDDPSVIATEAESALSEGNYDNAEKMYSEAIARDPQNSQYRLGHAKATVAKEQMKIMNGMLAFAGDLSGSSNAPIYQAVAYAGGNVFDTTTINKIIDVIDDLYQSVYTVRHDLMPIYQGRADGKIPKDDFELNINLAFARVVYSILWMLDTTNYQQTSFYFQPRFDMNVHGQLMALELPEVKTVEDTVANKKSLTISYPTGFKQKFEDRKDVEAAAYSFGYRIAGVAEVVLVELTDVVGSEGNLGIVLNKVAQAAGADKDTQKLVSGILDAFKNVLEQFRVLTFEMKTNPNKFIPK